MVMVWSWYGHGMVMAQDPETVRMHTQKLKGFLYFFGPTHIQMYPVNVEWAQFDDLPIWLFNGEFKKILAVFLHTVEEDVENFIILKTIIRKYYLGIIYRV